MKGCQGVRQVLCQTSSSDRTRIVSDDRITRHIGRTLSAHKFAPPPSKRREDGHRADICTKPKVATERERQQNKRDH